jgi:exoribonuclease II
LRKKGIVPLITSLKQNIYHQRREKIFIVKKTDLSWNFLSRNKESVCIVHNQHSDDMAKQV